MSDLNKITASFKNSPEAKLYKTFKTLHFDCFSESDLLDIVQDDGSKICVLLIQGEPHRFDPGGTISRQWVKFKDLLLKYKIFNCDFYVTTYFSNDHVDSFKYLNNNFYDWRFYEFDLDVPSSHIDLYTSKFCDNDEIYLADSVMKISYMNFTHRMHRQLFSKFILKENLADKNMIAIHPPREITSQSGDKLTPSRMIKREQNDGWLYNKKLLDLWKDTPISYVKHPEINDKDIRSYNFLSKAAFHIVSETVFDYPFQNCTEKTAQAILCKRPFVMIGPAGNLQYLQSKGFKTFGDIIDESYDGIDDPNLRFEAITKLVLDLTQKSQKELNEMVYCVKDRLNFNCQLLLDKAKRFTNSTI